MNREIKFRAWDATTSQPKMLLWNDLKSSKCEHVFILSEDVTIMQFTGLKDRKGKEIYEGDIVNGCQFNGSIAYGKIVWSDFRFVIYPIGKFLEGLDYIKSERLEIIGNIYESPELLK
jgi:uncharacterized phage protein (TIGR01671 family)